MLFTEAIAEVRTIIKRKDLDSTIKRELNSAMNFFSVESDFARDLEEISIAVNPNLYAQNISLNLLPGFRKIVWMKPPIGKKLLAPISPRKIFSNCCEESNCYYLAGNQLNLRLAALTSTILVGYMKAPSVLTGGTDTYWMLEVSPYMIIDRAAGNIFKNLGNQTESATHLANSSIAYMSAVRDYKLGYRP